MTESRESFTVLTVCTGNICRSPVAERLIYQLWVAGSDNIHVESAGIQALVGAPIQITLAHLLEQAGAYSGEFAAMSIGPDTVARADLVLAMTRRHRAVAVGLAPAAVGRAFTLREFARIVVEHRDQFTPGTDRAADLARLALVASRNRSAARNPDADDIADPYGRAAADYERAFTEIRHAVASVAAVLTGEPLPETPRLAETGRDGELAQEGLLSRLRRRKA